MTDPEQERLSSEALARLAGETVERLTRLYEPGKDRKITPQNVYQPAVLRGQDVLEAFQRQLLLPGSCVEGLAHLDHCLGELEAGHSVIFLPEHRGNLDVPSFNALLRAEDPRYHAILDRLVYIAGRKLNESSDYIKMFTEKYARLVIVPRRDFPPIPPDESEAQREVREEWMREAQRINRAAFREMLRLKRDGRIFVLFPLGGRLKADADNRPVKETASYLHNFDTAYLISMEGNTLPPRQRMEDELPIQERVVFRVSRPVDCAAYLAWQRERYEAARAAGEVSSEVDHEQYAVAHIMAMLERLRTEGAIDAAVPGPQ